jgi:zinc transport system substrate-binding protein
VAFVACIFLSGCSPDKTSNITVGDSSKKVKVVATLFPQYDFAKQIAKDKAEVVLLLPPGVEAHSYDPTPRDIVGIRNSDIFIFTNRYMEPWVERVIEGLKGSGVIAVDSSAGISFLDEASERSDASTGKDTHSGKDPHVWLNPLNARIMVGNITEALVKADPENKSFYEQNAESYKKELLSLDKKIEDTLKKTKHKKIAYAGHFAFGYFADRYGLDYISPYKGFSPNAEPTPKRVADLIDIVKESGIKVIYYEELVDPKVAEVISKEAGVKMMLLHGAHNISKDELDGGATYMNIMESNLEKLKEGLGYDE